MKTIIIMRKHITLLLVCCCTLLSAQTTSYKFDFSGKKKAKDGYTLVSPETLYTPESGYGYDFVGDERATVGDQQPFYFSVNVPDGNYRVNIVARQVSPPCVARAAVCSMSV